MDAKPTSGKSGVVFENHGSTYDKGFCEKRARQLERFMKDENSNRHLKVQRVNVLNLLSPRAGDSFLDIGCGSGKFEIFISPTARITGVDISEEGLANARYLIDHFGNPRNVTLRKFEPPLRDMFPGEKFNKIFMADSSEHMPRPVFLEILEDIKQLLTPGGVLTIYTPNKIHFMELMKPSSMTGHINLLTMGELLDILGRKNFKILKHYYRYSHIPVLNLLERVIPFPLFKRRLCVQAILEMNAPDL